MARTTYGHQLLRLSGCTIPFQLAMGQFSRLVRLLLTSPSWCEYIAISQTISPTVCLQLLLCVAIYMAINFNVHQHQAWYMIQKALVLPTLHSHWCSLLFSVCYFQSIRTGWDSRRFLCCRAVSRWASRWASFVGFVSSSWVYTLSAWYVVTLSLVSVWPLHHTSITSKGILLL